MLREEAEEALFEADRIDGWPNDERILVTPDGLDAYAGVLLAGLGVALAAASRRNHAIHYVLRGEASSHPVADWSDCPDENCVSDRAIFKQTTNQ